MDTKFTSIRTLGLDDTISYNARHDSKAIIILLVIASRPNTCSVVQSDKADKRRDTTGSDSNTDNATFCI